MTSINHDMIIESLKELSDRGRQEQLWMSSGAPEVSSFTEAVEQLFTDSGLEDALHKAETGLGEKAELALLKLERQLSRVNTRLGPRGAIDDPAMVQVRSLALEALTLLED